MRCVEQESTGFGNGHNTRALAKRVCACYLCEGLIHGRNFRIAIDAWNGCAINDKIAGRKPFLHSRQRSSFAESNRGEGNKLRAGTRNDVFLRHCKRQLDELSVSLSE
jgi:hypothetical protein